MSPPPPVEARAPLDATISSDSGSALEAGGPDSSANGPTVAFVFPPFGGLTDAPEISVRGTSRTARGVVEIAVNSIPVDGVGPGGSLESWVTRTRVPLAPGKNTIAVVAKLADGGAITASLNVSRQPILTDPEGIAWDSAQKRWVVSDGQGGLVSIDGAGAVVPIPISFFWSGVGALALDVARQVAYVATNESKGGAPYSSLGAFDLSTGAVVPFGGRSDASAAGTDASPAAAPPTFGAVPAIAFDGARNRILVLAKEPPSLLAVDRDTAAESTVSSSTRGTGPGFQDPTDVTFVDSDHVVVADRGEHALVFVDLATGNRTPTTTSEIYSPESVAFDTKQNLVVFYDSSSEHFSTYDPAGGSVTMLAFASQSAYPTRLAFDPDDGSLLAGYAGLATALGFLEGAPANTILTPLQQFSIGGTLDRGALALLPVDGSHLLVSKAAPNGTLSVDLSQSSSLGPYVSSDVVVGFTPKDATHAFVCTSTSGLIALDPRTFQQSLVTSTYSVPGLDGLVTARACTSLGGSAYLVVYTGTTPHVIAIDGSGATRVVSDDTHGSGPAFQGLLSIAADPETAVLYVTDSLAQAILRVDPITGARSFLKAPNTTVESPEAITFDTARHRLVVSADSSIYAVDPASGSAVLISQSGIRGEGPSLLGEPEPVAVSPDSDVIYRTDSGNNAIAAIDPESGDRIYVFR